MDRVSDLVAPSDPRGIGGEAWVQRFRLVSGEPRPRGDVVDEMDECSQMRHLGPQSRIDHVGKMR